MLQAGSIFPSQAIVRVISKKSDEGDACALQRLVQKKQKLSNVFRTKCFWSAMRSRIAFIFAMTARYVLRSQAALLPRPVSGPSRSMSRSTHS